ncbi:MAG: hypothetical protein ACKVPX_04720 [Myxococcaceae bacterium]
MTRTLLPQVAAKPSTSQKILPFRHFLAPSRPGTPRLRMNLAGRLRLEAVLVGNRKYALSVNRLFASDRALALRSNERQADVRGAKRELHRGLDKPVEHKAQPNTPPSWIAETCPTTPCPSATVVVPGAASTTASSESSPSTPHNIAHEVIAIIAVWRKSQTPSLTVSLRGAISGEVLLERAGRGAVAISLATSASGSEAEKLRTQLSEKLSEQGLHIARFNVSKS